MTVEFAVTVKKRGFRERVVRYFTP